MNGIPFVSYKSMDDEVDPATIVSKIQDLSDLELATLLCFVADQHCCIVQADEDQLDRVGRELELVPALFNLLHVL